MAVFIEHNLGYFGRRERVDHEVGGIRGPRDNVNLLALQLVDHGLHARTTHTHAGADRIHRPIPRYHRYFRTRAWIPRHGLYLDDPVIDFRHFLRAQLGHELRMRALQTDLWPARLAAQVVNEGADPVSVTECFARQQFVTSHDRFAAAEIDNHVAVFHPFDDAVDDIGNAVLVLLILTIALRFPNFLHNHLLR